MKALILVGGIGKRLRPLTCSRPKQLLPLTTSTMIEYMVEQLHHHNVNEIILAAGYNIDHLRNALKDGSHLGVTITYSLEPKPLGTAGPIKLAEPFLKGEELFLVMNGDIVANIDYTTLINYHQKKQSTAKSPSIR